MSDLSLENQNTAERQTELIATNADLGPDELKKFPDGVILQVKPGAHTAGSFDGINGVAGGTGRGIVGEGAGAGVAGFSRAGDGVVGTSNAVGKSGVFGFNSQGTGIAFGVFGRCDSPAGAGVSGRNDNGDAVSGFSVNGNAVKGHSESNDGIVGQSDIGGKSGVFGFNSQGTAIAFGVFGRCDSPGGAGVSGRNDNGDAVSGFSVQGVAIRGRSNRNDGVVGHSDAIGSSGVHGENTESPSPLLVGAEVFGVTGRANAAAGTGVFGDSANGVGIVGKGGQYGAIFEGGIAPLRLNPAANSGPPTGGFHQMGEFFVDSNGDLFYCKVAGTPGSWFRVSLVPAF